MSRGIQSLKYLSTLSGLVLAFDEKYTQPLRDGRGVSSSEMDQAWKELVELAGEIHPLVNPKKGSKKNEASGPRDVRPSDV